MVFLFGGAFLSQLVRGGLGHWDCCLECDPNPSRCGDQEWWIGHCRAEVFCNDYDSDILYFVYLIGRGGRVLFVEGLDALSTTVGLRCERFNVFADMISILHLITPFHHISHWM